MLSDIDKKLPIKEIYNDLAKPTVKNTGEVISLVPRAIKAALQPLEMWILKKEFNTEETKKLLEIKLSKISPEDIVTPEPYVAVPTIQAISYVMDNNELRNMYANLLASSMNKEIKDNVHPAYVEIIKQLTPDECRILKYIYIEKIVPLITLSAYIGNEKHRTNIKKNISLISKKINLDNEDMIYTALDNLKRLNIININNNKVLTNKEYYNEILTSDIMLNIKKVTIFDFNGWNEEKHYLEITELGKNFCDICIGS